ncbi:hypothetical protein MMC12_000966 [Toensbergia leucococca]|nr:hypothetical protein [Toensbergia leucococca]
MASPNSKSKLPSALHTLLSTLPTNLKTTTTQIAHLDRCFATTPHLDKTLLTLSYTLTLLSKTPPLSHSFLLSKISLPPLIALISDVRIFLRLWGLLGLTTWAHSTWLSPPRDPYLKLIAWAQVVVNILYQVLENGAYLAGKGVLVGWSAERCGKWWVWSGRFWMGHVGLEFLRLGRERWLWGREEEVGEKGGKEVWKEVKWKGAGREGKGVAKEVEQRWWRELGVNAAYAPLTLHYSLEGGCVSPNVEGVLGFAAGALGWGEVWRVTA